MTEHPGASREEARSMDAADGGEGQHPAAESNGNKRNEVVAEQTDRSPERSRHSGQPGKMSMALPAFLLIQAAFLAWLIWSTSNLSASEAEAAAFEAFGIIFAWVVADLVLMVCYGIWKCSDPDRKRK